MFQVLSKVPCTFVFSRTVHRRYHQFSTSNKYTHTLKNLHSLRHVVKIDMSKLKLSYSLELVLIVGLIGMGCNLNLKLCIVVAHQSYCSCRKSCPIFYVYVPLTNCRKTFYINFNGPYRYTWMIFLCSIVLEYSSLLYPIEATVNVFV